MAKVRNISDDVLVVPLLGNVTAEPDEVIDVPDKMLEDYDWPETVWSVVTAPASKTLTKGKE